MQRLIYRCADLHLTHIATSGDPFEFGSARPLDFGHWAAHKLEQLSEYKIRHGEAVAIGIALDVVYARKMGFLDAASADRILFACSKRSGSSFAPANCSTSIPTNRLSSSSTASRNFVNISEANSPSHCSKGIGKGFEVHEMCLPRVVEAIHELQERHAQRSKIYRAFG